jgi:hypothetical protein
MRSKGYTSGLNINKGIWVIILMASLMGILSGCSKAFAKGVTDFVVKQSRTEDEPALGQADNDAEDFEEDYVLFGVPVPTIGEMVYIQGGSFEMGNANAPEQMEIIRRVHTVTLKSFYIGKYQVTQREWQDIMENNPSKFKVSGNQPVDSVSWFDAVEYCNKRSLKEGLTPVYWDSGSNSKWGNNITWDRNANGYRLPTEEEWEYVARGRADEYMEWEWDELMLFPGTYQDRNPKDAVAWHFYNGINYIRGTKPVGTKEPNSLGPVRHARDSVSGTNVTFQTERKSFNSLYHIELARPSKRG